MIAIGESISMRFRISFYGACERKQIKFSFAVLLPGAIFGFLKVTEKQFVYLLQKNQIIESILLL
jgi:hypothetical protein